jgi:hypothetical protein
VTNSIYVRIFIYIYVDAFMLSVKHSDTTTNMDIVTDAFVRNFVAEFDMSRLGCARAHDIRKSLAVVRFRIMCVGLLLYRLLRRDDGAGQYGGDSEHEEPTRGHGETIRLLGALAGRVPDAPTRCYQQ